MSSPKRLRVELKERIRAWMKELKQKIKNTTAQEERRTLSPRDEVLQKHHHLMSRNF